MKGQICTLGLVVCLSSLVSLAFSAALLEPEPAGAHSTASSNDVVVATSRNIGGTKDYFWVIDTATERLLVYEITAGVQTLGAVRNIHWDLLIPGEISRNGKQEPSVSKVKKDTATVKVQPVARTRKIIAVPGRDQANQHDLLYVVDTGSMRQVAYSYRGGLLKIQFARNMKHDLKLDEWPQGGHDPSVKDVKEKVEGKKNVAGETSGL